MIPKSCINCQEFLCNGINKESYIIPEKEIDPGKIKIIMIAESPPLELKDFFYSEDEPFYMSTTIQVFKDADIEVSNIDDILNKGLYITTAIKCAKNTIFYIN